MDEPASTTKSNWVKGKMSDGRQVLTEGGGAATEFVLKLLESYAVLHAHGTAITRTAKQTPARWQVMGALSEQAFTVSQIARRIGNTRQAVQRIVNEMLRDQIVQLADNPDHARSPIVSLTTSGRKVYNAVNSVQAIWANAIAKEIDLRNLKDGVALLHRFNDALDQVSDRLLSKPPFKKRTPADRRTG